MAKLPLLGSVSLALLPLGAAVAADDVAEVEEVTKPTAGPLLAMDGFTLPIIDSGRIDGRLSFEVVLEARNDAASQELSKQLPQLRAAALSAGSEFSRLSASPFLAVDAKLLAADLTNALQAEDEGIARVLLVKVASRPA